MRQSRRSHGSGLFNPAMFALPLLLAMVAQAAVIFAASLTTRALGQQELDRRIHLMNEAQELRGQIDRLRWLVDQREPDRPAPTESDFPRRTVPPKLLAELLDLQSRFALRDQQIRDLDALEGEVRHKRRSQEFLDEEAKKLKADIDQIQKQADDLSKKWGDLVAGIVMPKGEPLVVTKDAVFLDCLRGGVAVVGTDIILPAIPSPYAQQQLLERIRQRGAVFFIVRESGFDTFRAYRGVVEGLRLTQGKKASLGFEPVADDATLEIGEKDGQRRLIIHYKGKADD